MTFTNSSRSTRPRQRRNGNERGLPSDIAIRDLATTYLECQATYFPDIVKANRATEAALNDMVRQFKGTFLAEGAVDFSAMAFPVVPLGVSYSRYSDANSNPRSLSQQLRLELGKASLNGHFIPWELVLADAAVTGTTAHRRGYELAKQAISDPRFECIYIDEIGRASRDCIESLMLGRQIEDLNKRLVGASDGFDSQAPMAKMQLAMFAMMHEWFVDQLRSKVNRGMADAFERGSNTGKPAPGYVLAPQLDRHGNSVTGADGDETHCLQINPDETKDINRFFKLYAESHWSPERIGKLMNRMTFHGSKSWDGGRVRQLLRRWTYIGVLTYRMTRQVRDRSTGKVKVIKRPRKEWKVRRARHLQIIPFKLWKATQRRLAAAATKWSNKGTRPKSGVGFYPQTLFRPICGDCGRPLILGRSGRYAAFKCGDGCHGKHGCNFKGYKNVSIIEKSLLAAIQAQLLPPELAEQITSRANAFLADAMRRPKADTRKLKAGIKELKVRLSNLYKLAERGKRLDQTSDRIQSIETRLKKMELKLRCKERNNEPPPPPLTATAVLRALTDLQGLLRQDISKAAPLLAEITGPITIHQVREKGQKRPVWIAKLETNPVPALVKLAKNANCPSVDTWAFLNTQKWTISETVEVRIERVSSMSVAGRHLSS